MKKLYTLTLAAAVAISASAAGQHRTAKLGNFQTASAVKALSMAPAENQQTVKPVQILSMKKIDAERKNLKRNAGETYSIEGTYTMVVDDSHLTNGSGIVTTTATIEYDSKYQEYYIIDDNEVAFASDIPFVFNANTNTLIIETFELGLIQSQGVYAWFFPITLLNNTITFYNSMELPFDPSTGTISFDEGMGFAWPATANAQFSTDNTNLKGYFGLCTIDSMTQSGGGNTPGGDDDADWTAMGDATFIDGWVLPAFGIDQFNSANQYKVPLQRNKTNPNIYRLVDPYKVGPAAQYNTSKTTGYIQFDVTDPDHVMFQKANAGFASSQLGVSNFYCYNSLYFYVNYIGVDADLIIEVLGDEIPYTTFKDGVITLDYVEGVDEDGPFTDYDANFGVTANDGGGYVWTDQNKQVADMRARIIFPDGDYTVKSITVSDPEAYTIVDEEGNVGAVLTFTVTSEGYEESEDEVEVHFTTSRGTGVVEGPEGDNKYTITVTGLEMDRRVTITYWATIGDDSSNEVRYNYTTSGVGAIATENANVRYFNLQGVEVTNPQAGEIVIAVSNGKATKIVK